MEIEFTEREEGAWYDAIRAWGPQHQMTMGYEECGELIQALAHYERGRCGIEKVIEEFGDMFVCVGQVIHDVQSDCTDSTADTLAFAIMASFDKLRAKLRENDKNHGDRG